MRENKYNPVIVGEKTTVMLWGFRVNIKDRRDGYMTGGYAVVSGNEDYDIEEAKEEVKSKYAALGYDVVLCEYDETRTFNFDAVEIFREAATQKERCRYCEFYEPADESVGLIATCQLANDDEKIENNEEWQQVVKASENYGDGCPCFELSKKAKKAPEDKPDYLAEIMATLDELEKGE